MLFDKSYAIVCIPVLAFGPKHDIVAPTPIGNALVSTYPSLKA